MRTQIDSDGDEITDWRLVVRETTEGTVVVEAITRDMTASVRRLRAAAPDGRYEAGCYGVCPRTVCETYQRESETDRAVDDLLHEVRETMQVAIADVEVDV